MTNINSKSTKAQILDAYKQLEKEKAQIQKRLETTQNTARTESRESRSSTMNSPTTRAASSINPSTQGNNRMMNVPTNSVTNIEQVIKSLETLQVNFGSAVSQLSEQLITEATSLDKLQTNIAEEVNELNDLHDVETIEDDTLDELLATYQASKKSFTAEYAQKEDTLKQELEDLSKEWLKERENHQRQLTIRNDNYAKTQAREEEEYQYNLQLARDIDRENYEQELTQRYQQLEEERQEQEKIWAEREKTISEKEQEYATAKQKVAEFEALLKAEVKKASDAGKGIGTYQAKIKADLIDKEIEGKTQNYTLRIQALESTIHNNQVRINSLNKQLDATLKQVQDLAVKAIEGSSNRNSFEAMKQVALEQAKNQPKGK